MNLKTLAQKDAVANLSKLLGIDKRVVLTLLEILNSGKIAQPSKAFKEGIAKLKSPKKHEFTYLDLGKKQYFLPGAKVPFDQLKALLASVNKTLTKTTNGTQKIALEQQVYFLEQLAQLSLKGFAAGIMFFSKNTKEKEGQTTFLMSVKNNVAVGGKIKKGNLAAAINNISYKMIAKNGDQMAFQTSDDLASSSSESAPNKAPLPITSIVEKAKESFLLFKNEILPALKTKTLSQKQTQQLKEISTDFESFNQALTKNSPDQKATHQKLFDAVQKAAALIIQHKGTGKGGDIINDDNVFSKEEKAAIQSLVKSIQKGLPLVKTQVVPNLKASKSTTKDKTTLSDLIDNITRFNKNFDNAPAPVQKQLNKFHVTVQKQHKQLQGILQKLETKAAEQLQQMLSPEQRREIMDTAKTEVDQILKELETMNVA